MGGTICHYVYFTHNYAELVFSANFDELEKNMLNATAGQVRKFNNSESHYRSTCLICFEFNVKFMKMTSITPLSRKIGKKRGFDLNNTTRLKK